MKPSDSHKGVWASFGNFLKTWGMLFVVTAALGISISTCHVDQAHFEQSSEQSRSAIELQNKQYKDSIELAGTALERESKHYQELSTYYEELSEHYRELRRQYEEVAKPYIQHEKIRNKLLGLDAVIGRTASWISSREVHSETAKDLHDSLDKANSLRNEALKAWVADNYSQADKLIGEAYDILLEIPVPSSWPYPGGAAGAPPLGLSNVGGRINTEGILTEDVFPQSFDGLVQLVINKGTRALDKLGNPLYYLIMIKMEYPPPLPIGFKFIGLVYDFGPEGATFDPGITLTFTYDATLLPEGFNEENLVIAMWDEATGEWVILDSTVDPDTNSITTQVSHFTPFAILAGIAPAAFTISDLAIVPSEAVIGERVTISALVNNTGSLSGSYEVTLKINDVVSATEEVTLPGYASQKVTFTTTKDVAGIYIVDINGLASAFMVSEAPPPPEPTPPPPVPPPAILINWYLIGGIIAGCIIIGLIIWLTVRQRYYE